MVTPGIVVLEFGSVVIAGRVEVPPFGLAGMVTTLVPP